MNPKVCMRGQWGSHMSVGLRNLAAECLVPDSVVAEIGVYAGQSTLIFLKTGLVRELWAVDPWEDGYDPQDPTSQLIPMGTVYRAFLENIAEFGDKVIVHRDYSVNVASLAPDNYFDLVYIDAKHQYGDVVEDITAWKDKVKRGGYISGHDYYIWSGVGQAVRDILGEPDRLYIDESWAVRL